jgi:biopolymer transport protein ExbD
MSEMNPEQAYWFEKKKQKKKLKMELRRKSDDPSFTITSLLDALVIILIFLLKTYGSDPINITQKEGEMLLPKSVTMTNMADAVDILISASTILVRNNAVVNVKNGKVDANSKRDGPDGFFIDPLFKKLKDEAKKLKAAEKQGGAPFKGDAILAVHKGTPYRLLAEVLYTANQAEFKTYTFAIVKMRD